MVVDIRNALIELARLRRTETYTWLNNELGMSLNFDNGHDRGLIGDWLVEVSTHEHEQGRPLLSALITHKNGKREQGDGFYKLCEEIYNIPWEDLKGNKKWENKEIARCFEFWLHKDNFTRFKNDY